MKNNRRDFLQKIGLGTAGFGIAATLPVSTAKASTHTKTESAADDNQYLQIGDDLAIAQTSFGKVQGYILNGVYTYLGIPYGADTSEKTDLWLHKNLLPGLM